MLFYISPRTKRKIISFNFFVVVYSLLFIVVQNVCFNFIFHFDFWHIIAKLWCQHFVSGLVFISGHFHFCSVQINHSTSKHSQTKLKLKLAQTKLITPSLFCIGQLVSSMTLQFFNSVFSVFWDISIYFPTLYLIYRSTYIL